MQSQPSVSVSDNWRKLIMTSRTNATCIVLIFVVLVSMACQQPAANNSANANVKATPANTAVAVKPPEAETKPVDPAPVGKEIKLADGPKLKSIEPAEGTILGGVLNDIATSLPAPDAGSATETGTVTVEVIVNEKGVVTASSVVSGPQPLWRAAGEAARQAKFDPPLHNGKPVKVAGVLTYEFKK
jgi:TonB family protein